MINWTEQSEICSEIILVIEKVNERAAWVWFEVTSTICLCMASRYCQKSSSFPNLLKIPLYVSRYIYNWVSFPYRLFSFTLFLSRCSYNRSSFQYKVFSFTLSLLRSRRKLDEMKKSRRKLDEIDEEISTKTRQDFVHHREPISVLFFSWERAWVRVWWHVRHTKTFVSNTSRILSAACKNESSYRKLLNNINSLASEIEG